MGRIGLNYEDVAQAARQLQGRSQSSTVDNIRALLGTGSKTTIARHLKAWKQEQGLMAAGEGAMPSELLALVKGLWDRLTEKANQQADDYKLEVDQSLTTLQAEYARTQQQNQLLETRLHQGEEQSHQQLQQLKQLETQLVQEQQAHARMAERNTALESRHQDSQAEIERLHQLLQHVQKNLEHYQASSQQLRQEQSLLLETQVKYDFYF